MKIKPTTKRGQVTVRLNRQDESLLEKSARKTAGSSQPMRIRKILVPTDFSDCAAKALDYALAFALQFDAGIVLLHMVEPPIYPENYYVPSPAPEDLSQTALKAAQERLNDLCRERIGRRVAVESTVRLGRAYFEITDSARALNADLIILATHGYTGLKHVLLGSTAERVVRHAPCPVLTIREREHDFVERA